MFPSSLPAGRSGSKRLRSLALVIFGALAFLVEAALVLYWLDPAILAHMQRLSHNRLGGYGRLLPIVVVNVLLVCGVALELSAPRTRFEHVVNVLALPIFAAFCDTLLLVVFADPNLPNLRIGELVVIAVCFANLSMGPYVWGLWWAMGHPYRARSGPPPADEVVELSAAGAVRLGWWVWDVPSVARRPIAPIGQVALLGPTLAVGVAQVAVMWTMQAAQVSNSWLLFGLVASFVSMAIVTTLYFIAYRRAAPMLPRLRRL
jgi:hypothetical protein